jgi:diguanylate cyclase (GGDEF)-like protein
MLLAQRGETRSWWAFTGCNIAFLSGYSLVRLGLERFVGVDCRREAALTLTVAIALLLWLGPDAENAPWRVVLIYGAGAWLMLRVLFALRFVVVEFSRGWAVLVALPVLVLGVSSGAMAIAQMVDMQKSLELHQFSMANVRILFVYMLVAGAFNLSFVVLVNLRLVQRLRFQNERDELTGLFNRRALDGALSREWDRFKRSKQSFAVLMIDIDHFKQVNDVHGHAAGDVVLQEVARRIRNASRTLDMPVRQGGEEFLVLMPLCDAAGAQVVAERVRAAMQAQPVRVDADSESTQEKQLTVTVSVGVAVAQPADSKAASLLERADSALYAVKRAGRNRVQVAD